MSGSGRTLPEPGGKSDKSVPGKEAPIPGEMPGHISGNMSVHEDIQVVNKENNRGHGCAPQLHFTAVHLVKIVVG